MRSYRWEVTIIEESWKNLPDPQNAIQTQNATPSTEVHIHFTPVASLRLRYIKETSSVGTLATQCATVCNLVFLASAAASCFLLELETGVPPSVLKAFSEALRASRAPWQERVECVSRTSATPRKKRRDVNRRSLDPPDALSTRARRTRVLTRTEDAGLLLLSSPRPRPGARGPPRRRRRRCGRPRRRGRRACVRGSRATAHSLTLPPPSRRSRAPAARPEPSAPRTPTARPRRSRRGARRAARAGEHQHSRLERSSIVVVVVATQLRQQPLS
mmetsp:Transcript_24515/g.97266  ORF Transcript_24515/g.97266 Transcript_24515/m.97266 type:complete len:273 (-) Transcript_24515:1291-2109(-)